MVRERRNLILLGWVLSAFSLWGEGADLHVELRFLSLLGHSISEVFIGSEFERELPVENAYVGRSFEYKGSRELRISTKQQGYEFIVPLHESSRGFLIVLYEEAGEGMYYLFEDERTPYRNLVLLNLTQMDLSYALNDEVNKIASLSDCEHVWMRDVEIHLRVMMMFQEKLFVMYGKAYDLNQRCRTIVVIKPPARVGSMRVGVTCVKDYYVME